MLKIIQRFFWRDIQSGEFTILLASLVLAVATVLSITLFAEKLQKALIAESNSLLAADLVLASPDHVDAAWIDQAVAVNLRWSQTLQFPSMVFAGDEMFLASIKAVGQNYPLLGSLEIASESFGLSQNTKTLPRPGEAWLDSRLLNLLKVEIGDEIWVGEKSLRVSQILSREPDGGSSYWSLGPRLLMTYDDVPATQVVREGSRVEYRYLFSGPEHNLRLYKDYLQSRLQPRHRLLSLEDEQPGLASSLDRAKNFLLLSGSLAVLLAAIAVSLASRRYAVRHFNSVALLKVLGARNIFLYFYLLLPLFWVWLAGSIIGIFCGELLQFGFLHIMQEWLPAKIPEASWRPYGLALFTSAFCLLGFAVPLLWPLLSISPLSVLRQDTQRALQKQWPIYLMVLTGIFMLMWVFGGHWLLASYVFGGSLLAISLSAFAAWVLLTIGRYPVSRTGRIWRIIWGNLSRNSIHSILQLAMFSLVFMLMLISILTRTSLVQEWQRQLPEDTPNHFLINIAPHQVQPVENVLNKNHLYMAGMYPMVRGRLTHVNGEVATEIVTEEVDELYRELNLSWSDSLPEDNQVLQGKWWVPSINRPSDQLGFVSIENGLANRLGIEVGDQLDFSIGAESLSVLVSNIRALEWDRMRPNFYFIFEPGILDNYPATYITSFYLPTDKKLFLNDFLRKFPTISIFEVDEIIRRIQKMVQQVTQAIELVLMLVLIGGLLVLIAAVQVGMDQRIVENTLLRSLGASRGLLLRALFGEFFVMGLMAGLLAALSAEGLSWVLQHYVFKVNHVFYVWPWLVGPSLAVLVISTTGVLACLHVLRVPPWRLLQEKSL